MRECEGDVAGEGGGRSARARRRASGRETGEGEGAAEGCGRRRRREGAGEGRRRRASGGRAGGRARAGAKGAGAEEESTIDTRDRALRRISIRRLWLPSHRLLLGRDEGRGVLRVGSLGGGTPASSWGS